MASHLGAEPAVWTLQVAVSPSRPRGARPLTSVHDLVLLPEIRQAPQNLQGSHRAVP